MSQNGQSELSDDVTVLVFKDNYSARTFQIPLTWISRFGFMLGILSGITLLSTFFAVKFYRVTRHLDPTRIQDLEQEIADLKTKAEAAPVPLPAPTTPLGASTPASNATVGSETQATQALAALPVPTVTVTVTAAPPATAPAPAAAALTASGSPVLFSAVPATIQPWPAGSKLPITIESPRASWAGKTLKVRFNIQYVHNDQGSQQGRIIILARGPETILAYPDGALSAASTGALIAPERGEYFSVSRFRETLAEFGPLRAPKAIQEAEIILFSQDGKLLAHQVLTPENGAAQMPAAKPKSTQPAAPAPAPKTRATGAAPAPATPARTAPPAAGGGDLIEPGVDQ